MHTAWNDKSDAELLRHIQEGSQHAFAVLVQRHTRRFYALACRTLGNRDEAEDIVQDAFIKLWQKPDAWQPDRNSQFTTWFYRIVLNQCLDELKRKKPLPLYEEFDLADSSLTPQDEALSARQRETQIDTAIRALPERQQTALNLCFYEELSNKEAAGIMGIHTKALESLLMRAKATLKARLKPHETTTDITRGAYETAA
jgi:RNA polymerase sigma-70 factor (ECF subfamily)